MDNLNINSPTDSGEAEGTSLPNGLSILEAIWGPGLLAGHIYEIHSDLGDGMVKIALQLATGAAKRGLNIAYVDPDGNVGDSLLDEFIRSQNPVGNHRMGRVDHFMPLSLDDAGEDLLSTGSGSKRCDLVIIDSLEVLAGVEWSNGMPDMQDLEEQFLQFCRKVIADTGQTLLLLTHMPAAVDRDVIVPDGTEHLDRMCDFRTAVSEGTCSLHLQQMPSSISLPCYHVWFVKGQAPYRFRTLEMIQGADGAVDDPASMVSRLMHFGGVSMDENGYQLKGVAEVFADWDQLRHWAHENQDAVRLLMREVMAS